MKAGALLREVTLRDGTAAWLRGPRWEDVDGLLSFINSLVEEDYIEIAVDTKKTREEELDWLSRQLVQIEKGEGVMCLAEVDGRVAGNTEITRRRGIEAHVGVLGISVHRDFRDRGLGTALLETVLDEARSLGLRIVWLTVFATNDRARHVYEKVGFREVGRIPQALFKYERYIDEILMAVELV
jgi:RimJ/RimL family protein N-acetyltransferase